MAIADPILPAERSVELLISGTASSASGDLFANTRFRSRILDLRTPISTEVKLLRSVFTKGLEALLIETLTAADRYGARAETHRSLSIFMQNDFDELLRILVGTAMRHARRRAEEMDEAAGLVAEALGISTMTSATAAVLHSLANLVDASRSEPAGVDDVLRIIDLHLYAPSKTSRRAGIEP